jgi:hypothetical protein
MVRPNSERWDVEKLRERLLKMRDEELIQFIDAARHTCSTKNPPETFTLQLWEARAEWLRRQPTPSSSADNPE